VKRFIFSVLLAMIAASVLAADDGVSGRVGQPGFHGRIEIGDAPEPRLIYPQPLTIKPVPGNVASVPIYLYVPASQARDWGRYCRRYDACSQPVYFVSQDWYENVYVPRYRARYLRERRVYAHDIHSAVVRAHVIRAHDVHAEMVFTRNVYRIEGEPVGSNGEDIHAPVVESGEIQAHDIHAHVIEADALYVHDLHVNR